MADDTEDLENQDGTEDDRDYDSEEAFAEAVEKVYADEDQAAADADDEMEEEEEVDRGDSTDDEDEEDAEHTAAGTSGSADGQESESDDDSADDDDEEHPDEDDSDDSDDDATDSATDDAAATADTKDTPDAQDDIAETTRKLLASRGADLSGLEKLPPAARVEVQRKLKGIDAAFTRVMQDAKQVREREVALESERRFNSENAEHIVVELLRKDPGLFDKVNKRLEELENPTQAGAYEIVMRDKRAAVDKAVQAEYESANRWQERGEHVETTARTMADKVGLPWEFAELGILQALQAKPEGQQDLTDDEIAAVVARLSKPFLADRKQKQRDDSKKKVADLSKKRTAAVKLLPPKAPTSSAPKPKKAKAEEIDVDDDEAVMAAMMRTARRVLPGRK